MYVERIAVNMCPVKAICTDVMIDSPVYPTR